MSEGSKYFRVGDFVDIKDTSYGSWFMAKLVRIKKDLAQDKSNDPNSQVKNDGLIYVVQLEG